MNTLLSTILSVTILGGYPQDNSISKDLYYSYLPIVNQATNNCRGAKMLTSSCFGIWLKLKPNTTLPKN